MAVNPSHRTSLRTVDHNLLYFYGFVAKIEVRFESSPNHAELQVLVLLQVPELSLNLPPSGLWLDLRSSLIPGCKMELNLLLLQSVTMEARPYVEVVLGRLCVSVWEHLKKEKVLKYFIRRCATPYFVAKTPQRLHHELQNESFRLQDLLLELVFELILFVPFIILADIALVLLPGVLTYVTTLIIHRAYNTPKRNLQMSSFVGRYDACARAPCQRYFGKY